MTDLDGKIDCVLVDAPCTGIGTWRRNPDAKWRLRPGSLEVRLKEQAAVLDRAAAAGEARRPDRLHHLLGPAGGERRRASPPSWRATGASQPCRPDSRRERPGCGLAGLRAPTAHGLQLTPHKTGTDGFYVARAARKPDRRLFSSELLTRRIAQAVRIRMTTDPDPRQDPHRRFRLPGDPAHRAARARGGRLLRDRAVPEGRRGHSGTMKPKARDPVGRAGIGHGRQPARAAGDLRDRRAGPRHLLRPADHGAAARRQGRGRPPLANSAAPRSRC